LSWNSLFWSAARQLYNDVLGEALRRLCLLKESREWQKIRALPKGRERSRAFSDCAQKGGFTDYDLQRYGTRCKNGCWIGECLEAHATQSNAAGIRWRTDHVDWSGLALRPHFDPRDPDGVQTFALQGRVKYVRIARKTIGSRKRWFVQLVCSRAPKWKEKNPVGEGTVGLDLGPSTVAVVGDSAASLGQFCPGLPDFEKKVKKLKRAMDRSKRLSNPKNFNPDGTVKPGRREWGLDPRVSEASGESVRSRTPKSGVPKYGARKACAPRN
jgi:hypothetical protein